MGNIGLILSDDAYYGFKLTGISRCFLVENATGVRKALSLLVQDKTVALVLFEKKLKALLSDDEKERVESSQQPFFFEIDTGGSKYYTEELTTLVKKLGVNFNGS